MIEFEGWKELDRNLQRLKTSTARAQLRKALRNSAKPLAAHASNMAPEGATGRLKSSIIVSGVLTKRQKAAHKPQKDPTAVELFIGSTDPKAHLLEFGTHKMNAQPFMRPAWESGKEELLKRLGVELWNLLKKTKSKG